MKSSRPYHARLDPPAGPPPGPGCFPCETMFSSGSVGLLDKCDSSEPVWELEPGLGRVQSLRAWFESQGLFL